MVDYIDACVVLATVFRERDEPKCAEYLNAVGYKLHSTGVIAHYVVSETFVSVLMKTRGEYREESLRLAKTLLTELLDDGRVTVLKLSQIGTMVDEILSADYRTSLDDAFNLASALTAGCSRFVTIDRQLLSSERLRAFLRERGLKITEP